MGNRYVVLRENATGVANQDLLTIVSPSGRRIRLLQVAIGGKHTSSAAQMVLIGRSTGGATPGGALTPSKFDHNEQPAAASVVNSTWGTQPTMESSQVPLAFNAMGGQAIWNAPKGAGFEARNGENISIRIPAAGITPQPCSVSAIFEED